MLFVSYFLFVLFCVFSISTSQSTTNKANKDKQSISSTFRHRQLTNKKSHHRNKKFQWKHDEHQLNQQVILPSLAYDYSEIITTSIVSTSPDNHHQYVYFYMLGHESLYDNMSTYTAFSTDQEALMHWNAFTRDWPLNYSANYPLRLPHFQIHCVFSNNTQYRHKATVPAQWLHVQTPVSSSNNTQEKTINHKLDIFRCRMKDQPSTASNHQVYVDIVRSFVNYTSEKASKSVSTLALSFTLPKETNYLGYPSSLPHSLMSNKTQTTNKVYHTVACMGNIRPLGPMRAKTTTPKLIESIENLLALGVDHVYLGVMLTWNSYAMYQLLHTLHSYLESGVITVVSTSIQGIDDVPGLLGLVLNDTFADNIFYNQCYEVMKSRSEYVLLTKPSYLLHSQVKKPFDSHYLTSLHSKYSSVSTLQGQYYHQIPGKSHRMSKNTGKTSSKTSNKASTSTSIASIPLPNQVPCAYRFTNMVSFVDTTIEINPFGSDDFTWLKDYAKQYMKPHPFTGVSDILLLKTDQAMAIDSNESQLQPVCQHQTEELIVNSEISVLIYDDEKQAQSNGKFTNEKETNDWLTKQDNIFQLIDQHISMSQSWLNYTTTYDWKQLYLEIKHDYDTHIAQNIEVPMRSSIRKPHWKLLDYSQSFVYSLRKFFQSWN